MVALMFVPDGGTLHLVAKLADAFWRRRAIDGRVQKPINGAGVVWRRGIR